MTRSDDLLREIAGHLEEQNDKLEFQHDQQQLHQRIQRAERAHFLVTLGVLSGLLTYYFRAGDFAIRECFTSFFWAIVRTDYSLSPVSSSVHTWETTHDDSTASRG